MSNTCQVNNPPFGLSDTLEENTPNCSGTGKLRATLAALPESIDHAPHHRAAIGSGSAGKRRKKGSPHLRPRRLDRGELICDQLCQWNEGDDHDHPPPGPPRPQQSEQHAGAEHEQRREEQIVNGDVGPSRANARGGRYQVEGQVAVRWCRNGISCHGWRCGTTGY
jgi:hypothetical protein